MELLPFKLRCKEEIADSFRRNVKEVVIRGGSVASKSEIDDGFKLVSDHTFCGGMQFHHKENMNDSEGGGYLGKIGRIKIGLSKERGCNEGLND